MGWGAVDIKRHTELMAQGIDLHIFYCGHDVTDRCRFADDTNEGMAELYLLNADGRKYLDPQTQRPAVEIVYGVEIKQAPVSEKV